MSLNKQRGDDHQMSQNLEDLLRSQAEEIKACGDVNIAKALEHVADYVNRDTPVTDNIMKHRPGFTVISAIDDILKCRRFARIDALSLAAWINSLR